VQNFTDIDDKIIRRSQADHIPWEQITETYIQAYLEDMGRLNIRPADTYPRATKVIPQIIQFIERLIEKDYAYAANGDVYYAVERFPSYGKLSGRKLDQMEAGASGRVSDEETKKRHPLDFALWKSAKPGEPSWDSPWGKGRPGWHIECSVMVKEELGDSIDIHMGGQDLTFPHHENEIAQSEAALAAPLSRYWMHNGFVNISGEKMSKSLGNFTTIRQMLDAGIEPMVLRLFVLQAQYRKPIDFTDEAIASAQNAWSTLRDGLLFGYLHGKTLGWTDTQEVGFGDPGVIKISPDRDSEAVQKFRSAMDDDFNTSAALAVLFALAKELQKEGNRLNSKEETKLDASTLREVWEILVGLSDVLGLKQAPPVSGRAVTTTNWQGSTTFKLKDENIQALVEERLAARKAKNFAEADRIREDLKAQGIILIDKPGGLTEWRRE